MPTEFEKTVGQADPQTVAAARARDKAHMAAMSAAGLGLTRPCACGAPDWRAAHTCFDGAEMPAWPDARTVAAARAIAGSDMHDALAGARAWEAAAMDPTNEGCATAAHDYAPSFTFVGGRQWSGWTAFCVRASDWWRGFARLPDWWPVSRRAFHVEQREFRAEMVGALAQVRHDVRELRRAQAAASMDDYATLRAGMRDLTALVVKLGNDAIKVRGDVVVLERAHQALAGEIGTARVQAEGVRQRVVALDSSGERERKAVRELLAAIIPKPAPDAIPPKVRKARKVRQAAPAKAKPRTRKAGK